MPCSFCMTRTPQHREQNCWMRHSGMVTRTMNHAHTLLEYRTWICCISLQADCTPGSAEHRQMCNHAQCATNSPLGILIVEILQDLDCPLTMAAGIREGHWWHWYIIETAQHPRQLKPCCPRHTAKQHLPIIWHHCTRSLVGSVI